MGRRKKLAGRILTILGAVLVIFGALWVTLIFPGMNKIPGDLNQVSQQEGTVVLWDAEAMQPVTYNVRNTTVYSPVRSTAGVVYLREDNTFINTDTGENMPQLAVSAVMAVDRVNRGHVPERGDLDRSGYFSFPAGVEAGTEYPIWITGTPEPLVARHIGEEQIEGLNVMVFELATPEEGLSIPAGVGTPAQQLFQTIIMKVEPVSGTTVYASAKTELTSLLPFPHEYMPNTGPMSYREVTVYKDELVTAAATQAELLAEAKQWKMMLPWGTTHLPQIFFALGLVMVIGGPILMTRKVVVPEVEVVAEETPATIR